MDNKQHWDTVYGSKAPNAVSWYAPHLETSLKLIHQASPDKSSAIIDIGGGEATLVDDLLSEGYQDISVLDISQKAIDVARSRIDKQADRVHWYCADIIQATLQQNYFDVWHDRATFHFLTTTEQISKYIKTVRKSVTGFLTIGTFSKNGPEKCSGLEIKQYKEEQLTMELKDGFDKIKCITEDHLTPFKTTQNFLFCSFKRQLN